MLTEEEIENRIIMYEKMRMGPFNSEVKTHIEAKIEAYKDVLEG